VTTLLKAQSVFSAAARLSQQRADGGDGVVGGFGDAVAIEYGRGGRL
jgi:hypothetical protein